MANCIFNAFEKYKHEYDKRTITTPQIEKQEKEKSAKEPEKKKDNTTEKKVKKKETSSTSQEITTQSDITYKIQIFSSRTPIASTHYDYNRAKKFDNVDYYIEDNWYKYTCYKTNSYKEAEQKLTEVQKVFKDAMIIAFKNDKKIPLNQASNTTTKKTETNTNTKKESKSNTEPEAKKITFGIQIFSSRTLIPNDNYDMRRAKKYGPVKHFTENGWYKYFCAETDSYAKAKENLAEIREIFKDAVIVAFENNKKISLDEATNNETQTNTSVQKEENGGSMEQNNNEGIKFCIQVFSSHTLLPKDNYDYRRAKKYGPIWYYSENGWYKYVCAETNSYEKAKENLAEIRKIFKDAVMVAFEGTKKISVKEAINKSKN